MRTKSTCGSEMQIKLRGASQPDNRQVGMSCDMLNFYVKPGAWFAGNQRVRQRAWGVQHMRWISLARPAEIRGSSALVVLMARKIPGIRMVGKL